MVKFSRIYTEQDGLEVLESIGPEPGLVALLDLPPTKGLATIIKGLSIPPIVFDHHGPWSGTPCEGLVIDRRSHISTRNNYASTARMVSPRKVNCIIADADFDGVASASVMSLYDGNLMARRACDLLYSADVADSGRERLASAEETPLLQVAKAMTAGLSAIKAYHIVVDVIRYGMELDDLDFKIALKAYKEGIERADGVRLVFSDIPEFGRLAVCELPEAGRPDLGRLTARASLEGCVALATIVRTGPLFKATGFQASICLTAKALEAGMDLRNRASGKFADGVISNIPALLHLSRPNWDKFLLEGKCLN